MSVSGEQQKYQPLSASQMESLAEAMTTYQAAFTDEARDYLAGRGIDRPAQDGYRLGIVRDPMPGHSRFTGMLAIPYLDKNHQPLTIRFRCLEKHDHREHHHGKYNSTTGDRARLFNVGAIHRATDVIHITEGELDAMILDMLGLFAVAVPGASLWLPHFPTTLAGFNRVWIWSDPDEPGEQLAAKIIETMPFKARAVRLTVGDVGETFLAGGEQALFKLIGGK